MANRLSQVSGHISNAHGRGLLAGEVAIITGMYRILWPVFEDLFFLLSFRAFPLCCYNDLLMLDVLLGAGQVCYVNSRERIWGL